MKILNQWKTVSGFVAVNEKKDRETIRIDGHKTATLDYSQMNPNLLCGIEGETPLDDCYEIQGFEKNRNGIKSLQQFVVSKNSDESISKKQITIWQKHKS